MAVGVASEILASAVLGDDCGDEELPTVALVVTVSISTVGVFWTSKSVVFTLVDVGTVGPVVLIVEEAVVASAEECSVDVCTVSVDRAIVLPGCAFINIAASTLSDEAEAFPAFDTGAFVATLIVDTSGLDVAVVGELGVDTLVDIIAVHSRDAESVRVSPAEITSAVVASDRVCALSIVVAVMRKSNAHALVNVETISRKTESSSLSKTSDAGAGK